MNYWTIRGPRIITQLNELATYGELERNTFDFIPPSERREKVMNRIQVRSLIFVPYEDSNTLEVRGTVSSDGNRYQPTMIFSDVEYQDEDAPQNVEIQRQDRTYVYIVPINLNNTNTKVHCGCLDFRWRFAMYNNQADALIGPGPGNYKKTSNRPPNNRRGVPGLCKHLLKVAAELKNSNVVR